MIGQLPLPLGAVPRYGREDFLVGRPNENAFAYIERWPRWLAPAALLTGPEGAGKTHLATIFAQRSGAQSQRADRLTPQSLPRFAKANALVLEDADRYPAEEAALFHLLNLAHETGNFLVLTARTPPDSWGIRTPDLLSRLRRAPLLTLAEPDDSLLGALFIKHFADHQITLDLGVARYALSRIERSYAGVQNLVAALDRESLIRKKPVTRALVASVLGERGLEEGGLEDGMEEKSAHNFADE